MDYDLIVVKTLERVYKNYYYIIRGEVKEKGAVLAGPVAGLIHEIRPVKTWIVDFTEEWKEWLKKSYTLF